MDQELGPRASGAGDHRLSIPFINIPVDASGSCSVAPANLGRQVVAAGPGPESGDDRPLSHSSRESNRRSRDEMTVVLGQREATKRVHEASNRVYEATNRVQEERRQKIFDFASHFLAARNCAVRASIMLEAAYEQLASERFAHSRLALEAYVLEQLATSGGQFAFGNPCAFPGASWVFYRPCDVSSSVKSSSTVNLACSVFLPEIIDFCKRHLLRAPENKEDLGVLTDLAANRFAPKITRLLEPVERASVFRSLILIGCVRNLEHFVFSRREPILYLRRENLSSCIASVLPVRSRFDRDDESEQVVSSTCGPLSPTTPTSQATPNQDQKRHVDANRTFPQTLSRISAQTPSPASSPPFQCQATHLHSRLTQQQYLSSGREHITAGASTAGHPPSPSTFQNVPPRSIFSAAQSHCSQRRASLIADSSGIPFSPAPPPQAQGTPCSKNAEVLQLVANIIRARGPITKTELRDIWSAEARKDLRKVLGAGVSFALSFRKFESCFPAACDGTLTVNLARFADVLRKAAD